jgi:hypothetical protein
MGKPIPQDDIQDGIRLVMLEDANEVVRALETKNKISKRKPENCHKCHCEEILGVEVMGAYDGILFWECHQCETVVLRFQENTTKKYLKLAKGVWTNPSDWGYVPRSKFN